MVPLSLLVVVSSLFAPSLPTSVQADLRRVERARSLNRFVDVLADAGVIDAWTREADITLRCLEAPEPDVFIFSTAQAGRTREDVERAAASSLLAFNATGVRVDAVGRAARDNATFRIEFFHSDEMEKLRDEAVSIEGLSGSAVGHRPQKLDIDHIPIGRYADGGVCSISLLASNALVAGVPRSGKSVCLSALVCQLMRCRHELIYILSPKDLDFANFEGRCVVVGDLGEMIAVLEAVRGEMARRKALCRREGVKKIDRFTDDVPHITVIVDEFSVLKKTVEADGGKPRKVGVEFEALLTSLVEEGGFAGISFVLATQRMSSTNVSTDLRDLISGTRISFAQETAESDRMVFGDWAKDAPAHEIPTDCKGVGYVSVGGRRPRLFKCAMADASTERSVARETMGSAPQPLDLSGR